MKALIIGAGMMGRAIVFDLLRYSNFDEITVLDREKTALNSVKEIFNGDINIEMADIKDEIKIKECFKRNDIVISAVPYYFNYALTKIAIETRTHFLDLGGNNEIVEKQRGLFNKAKENELTIIPDCGLSPGLTSVIVKDIVEYLDYVDYVKIRVGGLPLNPLPPFNYQIVFSLEGLINEYTEDVLVLDNGKIVAKAPLTELETIEFPYPFCKLEAFLTSGGSSTLPYTFKDKIKYLDDKTIRYPGHCQMFKAFIDLGLASREPIDINGVKVVPREVFIKLLDKILPKKGKDVVLVKVLSRGKKNGEIVNLEYSLIDYFDDKNNLSAMMRTTGYPTSIIAQMIEKGLIKDRGVFCCEEIVPCKPFFKELEKRGIVIQRKER